MKKSLIFLASCFLTTIVNAQLKGGSFKIPPTLIMPDGTVVPRKSMDSIKKVFGGRDITFSLLDDGTVHVHPANNKAETQTNETKLNAHLDHPAPEFTLKDMDGKLYSLPELRGKIVVINFWYTQCGGCITEMPALNELKQGYSGNDVVFLAITFDDQAKIKTFLTKHKFDYTIIPNAKKVSLDYDIPDYPVSVVIDRSGIVRYIDNSIDGSIKQQLKEAIDKIKK